MVQNLNLWTPRRDIFLHGPHHILFFCCCEVNQQPDLPSETALVVQQNSAHN